MARIAIPMGRIRVEEASLPELMNCAHQHFGLKEIIEGDGRAFIRYTDAELQQLMADEVRQIWEHRLKRFKRENESEPQVDLS